MLSAHRIACTRGRTTLFEGLDLQVEPGRWLHVRGANGAGKTSLLRLLAGLAPPEAGEVRWQGQALARLGAAWRAALLYLGHAAGVKEDLTALENLRLGAAIEGLEVGEDAARSALQRWGLQSRADLPLRALSAGQRRRVLLARTLVRPAQAWILDEPLTALDAKAAETFSQLLRDHLARGGLAVVTSHQPLAVDGGQELAL